MNNLKIIFFDDWKFGFWLFTIIAIPFDFILPDSIVNWQTRTIIIGYSILLSFIIKLSYQIITMRSRKFKITGYAAGTGLYNNIDVLKIIYDPNLKVDNLLTLYDQSSSIPSPIAVIKIVGTNENMALGILVLPANQTLTMLLQNRGESNFYLSPIINFTTLQQFT